MLQSLFKTINIEDVASLNNTDELITYIYNKALHYYKLKEDVDVFSPCAMGAVINPTSIENLKCSVIAGAANNQLEKEDYLFYGWR